MRRGSMMKRSPLRRHTPLRSRRQERKRALPRPGVTPPMPPKWKAICTEIWIRDDGKCRRCGHNMSVWAVDHLIPRRLLRGRETAIRANLALLCAGVCHANKTMWVEPALYRGDVQTFERF